MAIKRERRSHNRLNVELPIIIRPEGGVSADLRCWTLDVTTKGLLLECDNYPEGLSFDGQAAEVWLAPTAVTPSGWRSLGNAQILHSNTSENKITRIGIRFVGAERKALAIPQLVGGSIAMHNMQAQIMQAANCDFNVLIMGETGTGKTLAAACIHQISRGQDQPFVAVNCPNISPSLFESELFGHEKGAYTDARTATPGFFRVAGAGTILLDEISELEPSLQAKLLRVLDERVFFPVGGHQPVEVRCRIIATSNADLHARMRQGTFRQDLYYRLCEVPIQIIALRERREDIPLLAEFLLRQHTKLFRTQTYRELSIELANSLSQRNWPGNVRELSSAMKLWLLGRPIENCGPPAITGSTVASLGGSAVDDLMGRIRQHKGNLGIFTKQIVAAAERERIMAALTACGGNHTHAAAMLGISYRTIARKLARLKLDGVVLKAENTTSLQVDEKS